MNRFRCVVPNAIPWRERAQTDPVAHALVGQCATDEEAADICAAECDRLLRELRRALELNGIPTRIAIDAATGKASGLIRG